MCGKPINKKSKFCAKCRRDKWRSPFKGKFKMRKEVDIQGVDKWTS